MFCDKIVTRKQEEKQRPRRRKDIRFSVRPSFFCLLFTLKLISSLFKTIIVCPSKLSVLTLFIYPSSKVFFFMSNSHYLYVYVFVYLSIKQAWCCLFSSFVFGRSGLLAFAHQDIKSIFIFCFRRLVVCTFYDRMAYRTNIDKSSVFGLLAFHLSAALPALHFLSSDRI